MGEGELGDLEWSLRGWRDLKGVWGWILIWCLTELWLLLVRLELGLGLRLGVEERWGLGLLSLSVGGGG